MDPILQTQELSEESVARARLLSSGLVCVIAAGTAREAGMQTQSSLKSLMHTLLISLVLAGFGTTAKAQGLPAYMAPISGHTTSSSAETALKDLLALTQVVGPYLDSPADQSWRGSMLAYRARMQSALDGLDLLPMPPQWREND